MGLSLNQSLQKLFLPHPPCGLKARARVPKLGHLQEPLLPQCREKVVSRRHQKPGHLQEPLLLQWWEKVVSRKHRNHKKHGLLLPQCGLKLRLKKARRLGHLQELAPTMVGKSSKSKNKSKKNNSYAPTATAYPKSTRK